MHVQVILFNGFDLLDVIGPLEVLEAASMLSHDAVTVELAGQHAGQRVPSGPKGIELICEAAIDLDRADLLIIPGVASRTGADAIPSLLWEIASGPMKEVWREAVERDDVIVGCVCGGALIPAMAGHLDDRHAVTHHLGMDALSATGARAIAARVVDDGDLVSSGGVTSGIDLALYLLERELGSRLAIAVESLFDYERRGTPWRSEGVEVSPWS